MFGWLRRLFGPESYKHRFIRHFSAAEGSYVQRQLIACAMAEIEGETAQEERKKLSPQHQGVFSITYACYLMWGMKQGLGSTLNRQEVESAIAGVLQHLQKQEWYRQDVYEKIWEQMLTFMPIAMQSTPAAPPYPVAEMLMAAHAAGYDLHVTTDIRWGMQISMALLQLNHFAQNVARDSLVANPA
jgi:hypothetical protein